MEQKKLVLPNEVMLAEVSALIAEGHEVVILTRGNSMLPFIVGDRDSVRLVKKDKLVVGDIALAEIRKGQYVLHRIISIDGEKVTLKGDGNLVGTEKCKLSDIRGVADTIIRPGRKEIDCTTESFDKISRRWRELPYLIRRVVLGVYRRII